MERQAGCCGSNCSARLSTTSAAGWPSPESICARLASSDTYALRTRASARNPGDDVAGASARMWDRCASLRPRQGCSIASDARAPSESKSAAPAPHASGELPTLAPVLACPASLAVSSFLEWFLPFWGGSHAAHGLLKGAKGQSCPPQLTCARVYVHAAQRVDEKFDNVRVAHIPSIWGVGCWV